MNPFTMFTEKSSAGREWSMTRTVAFLFALTVCGAVVLYARAAHDLTWPFAALGIVTLLAVPLQALCRYLQQWIASSPGQAVLKSAAEHVMERFGGRGDHEHDDQPTS